jgi:hypothetical protein
MAQKIMGGIKKLAIVRPSIIATTFSGRSVKFLKQQRLNAVLAALYATQAAVLLIFGHNAKQPVTLNYLASDPLQTAAQHKVVTLTASHHWFDVDVRTIVVLFLVVAAVSHLLFATVLRVRYEQSLTRSVNGLRWLSAGIISGLLAVAVALLSGATDAAILCTLLGLGGAVALGMFAVEANQKLRPWALFGLVPFLIGLSVGACYMVGGWSYGITLPAYVYAATVLLALGTIAVAFNLWLQIHAKGRWSDYLFAELVYVSIGFIGISLAAWVIFAGALQ